MTYTEIETLAQHLYAQSVMGYSYATPWPKLIPRAQAWWRAAAWVRLRATQ